jgi:hypothetical protein
MKLLNNAFLKIYPVLFVLMVEFELRTHTLSHSISPPFEIGVFKIGSCKLFVWAGFKP